MMKNIYYKRALCQNAESLKESDVICRRRIHRLIKLIIQVSNKKRIIVENYPKLNKNEQYIFAAGHSFPDEIAANLSVIDRPTYVLIGTTDQLINNPKMAVLWLNGLLYVNKQDSLSRKDSFARMLKVLQAGSSVMLFPEGVLNNSENLLCEPVFPGFYHLAIESGKQIVPIVSQTFNDSTTIRIRVNEPIDVSQMTKEQASQRLRDEISSMRYEMALNEPLLKRNTLTGDIHYQWMKERKKTYMEVSWTHDVWDEEIMFYKNKRHISPAEARSYAENVHVTKDNAGIIAPVLLQHQLDERYDFRQYMHHNFEYQKSVDKSHRSD